MNLLGNRIKLTSITEDDLDFLCQIECDKDLWYFEESVMDMDEARKNFLEKLAASETEEMESYDFIIRASSDQKATPIGIALI